MSTDRLKALILVCTLSPSPKKSSSDLLAQQVGQKFSELGVQPEILRVVDFNVLPGVLKDMGVGDE